jgi:hypothetical protein
MKLRLFSCIPVVIFLFLIVCPHVYAEEVILDGKIAKDYLRRDIKTLLYQEKYETLEKIAADLRRTKARFPDGIWKLRYFYLAFESPTEKNEEGWKHHLNKLSQWMERYPNSVTARVATGYGWLKYGTYARGTNYASTVSERRWQLLKERLDKAYELAIIPPGKSSEDCPERYLLLLKIALYQGIDDTQYEELFKKAIALEPGYYDYYIRKTMRLLPRWHGSEGDWKKFAEEAVKLTPEIEGMSIYASM